MITPPEDVHAACCEDVEKASLSICRLNGKKCVWNIGFDSTRLDGVGLARSSASDALYGSEENIANNSSIFSDATRPLTEAGTSLPRVVSSQISSRSHAREKCSERIRVKSRLTFDIIIAVVVAVSHKRVQ